MQIVAAIVFLVLVFVGIFYLGKDHSHTPSTVNMTQTGETATTTSTQDKNTFSSDTFGITFKYDSTQAGVEAVGNKVFVYPLNTDPIKGQSIQRFEKLPTETLEESIKRQILKGFSSTDCKVEVSQSNKYQGGYMTAEISYPGATGKDAPFWQNASLCNTTYDKTNGMRYFLYDTNHPDRFYFVDIGQYPILATENMTWQDTIVIK